MESLQDEIREIRKQLRLAMNGVISTSMREKGIVYKLNFGVPYPEIKEIARKHKPNGELAAALWKEDIREFKILATFLQPAEKLPLEEAKRWVKEIPYLEIAEHCCRNLFVHLPYMEDFTLDLVADKKNEFARTVAFLTWTENFKRGGSLSSVVLGSFLVETLSSLAETKDFKSTLKEKQASIQAMKFYGRQSEGNAERILDGFKEFQEAVGNTPELQEIYNELKFEFEYYRLGFAFKINALTLSFVRSLGDGSESLYGNTCVVYRISNGEETAENRGEIYYIQGNMCFSRSF